LLPFDANLPYFAQITTAALLLLDSTRVQKNVSSACAEGTASAGRKPYPFYDCASSIAQQSKKRNNRISTLLGYW
jgi:hypothetical protein